MEDANNPPIEENIGYKKGEDVDGEVSGITSFGAFIKLPNGEEGLVHISEVANSYVTNIEDFLKLRETVKVKILGKNQRGKWDLSIKQVGGAASGDGSSKSTSRPQSNYQAPPRGVKPAKKKDDDIVEGSFDDLMNKFLKSSDDVQLDVRRNLQYKQGVRKKGKKGKFG